MAIQNTATDLDARNWLILSLRFLLGGTVGILISSWFYYGIITHANIGSFLWLGEFLESILAVPFVGQIYLFNTYTIPFSQMGDLFFTPPVLLWGLIGALLASGRRVPIKIGITLLVIYVGVGCISFFHVLMQIPT